MSQVFFVGSYTKADFGHYQASGKGIYTCRLEPETGEMEVLACSEGVANPTYLTLDKAKQHLYAVQETGRADKPCAVAFVVKDDFSLRRLNVQPITGAGPCHLALDEGGKFLAVANYASGNVALCPVNEDGSLAEEAHSVHHEGRGANPDRQEGPHAHATVFGPDGESLFVADLGLDEVKYYHLNRSEAKLELLGSARTPAGAGPRHLVFHPSGSYVFVVNELDSTLSLFRFRYAASELTLLETVSTLPEGDETESYCAAIRIHPSGRFVYVSNRGHDSLAVFSFDETQEHVQLLQTVSTGGRWPRDFALDAEKGLAIAANQETNNLVSFWLDNQSGKLEPTGHELELGTPVCVAMA